MNGFAQILIPALVALAVALLTHFFTSARDKSNKRREQRINYLVGAFRALAKASNHPRLHEVAPDLEQAIADIQLFGTQEQVRLAHEFVDALASQGSASLDPLLLSVRNGLRSELGAPSIKSNIMWLRVQPKENAR